MAYSITGNDTDGYVLTHVTEAIKYSLCPCCDKPIMSRWVAENIAKKLTLLDEEVVNLRKGNLSCS